MKTMKSFKKAISVLLCAIMVLSILPLGNIEAEAATVTESSITSKLNSISSEYKGKSFSVNKSRCNHNGFEEGCYENCYLGAILDAKGISKSSYNYSCFTCVAFASYCFTQCFGKSYSDANFISFYFSGTKNASNVKKWLQQYGSIGDILYWDNHRAVVRSISDSGVKIMDANYGATTSKTGIVRDEVVSYSDIAKESGLKLLHAKNHEKTVYVTFNANGGTASSKNLYFIAGKIYGDTMPSATRDGYTFDGWYTSASGGTRVIRSSTVTSGNKTLYAHWTKNQTGVLEVGHVYRIYNENSGLVVASNENSDGALVCQRNKGEKGTGELWRVIEAGSDGYYKFESLNGCKALDVDADDRYAYGAKLQVMKQKSHDAQKFSIIKRGDKSGYSGLYSIHSKNSGRAIDVSDSSTKSGAALHQWDYHDGKNQLFYFEEVETRNITFYDNFNNNYIASPVEEYAHINSATPTKHYASRNTDYVKVTLKPDTDSLYIQALKAGSSEKDMDWVTLINGSYTRNFAVKNDSTMVLNFRAKSSVSGAKIYFRWGYDSTSTYQSVTLTNSWADYSVELKRTADSGSSLHPYIDKACNVEITNIALYEKGTTGYIGDTDAYSAQTVIANVNDDYIQPAPLPKNNRNGYTFNGWYTKRVGGTRVAGAAEYFSAPLDGAQKLYAHWTKNADANYTLSYDANGGTGAPESQNGATSYTVSSTIPTRSGYTFLGWSTSSASSATYVSGNTITLTANTTLYAVWKESKYTVTFYGNGGSDVPDAETFNPGESVTISEFMPFYWGYTFMGWSETADFSSTVYYPGEEVYFDGNTELIAIWTEYYAYQGYSSLDFSKEQPYFCIKFVPEKTDEYVIKTTTVYDTVDTVGYLVNSNGETIVGDDDSGEDSNFKISYNFTKGQTYCIYITTYNNDYGNVGLTVMPTAEITYDANGGYGAPDKSSHDIDYYIPYDNPYRDGYAFVGWSEYMDAEGASYYPGDDITVTEDTTLYAVWEENDEPITNPDIPTTNPDIPTTNPDVPTTNPDEPTPDPEPDLYIEIINPSKTKIDYKNGIILHAKISGEFPEGASVVWETSNGNFKVDRADASSCKIISADNGLTDITVKIVGADGEILAEDYITMTSNANFFQKIIAFFKGLFGILPESLPQVFKKIV